jgi:hypothetical protein
LGSERFKARGIFDEKFIPNKLDQIRSTELVDNKQVMALLILEIWFRTFMDGDG